MADNLIKKKGESTWYVKLAIPADVRKAFGGKAAFIQSLKTGLRSEAMNRRLPLLASWKAQIQAAREKRTSRGDGWKEEIATSARAFDDVFRQLKTGVALGEVREVAPPDPADIQELHRLIFDDTENGRRRRAEANRVYAMPGLDGEMALHNLAHQMLIETFGEVVTSVQELSPAEAGEMQGILIDPKAHKQRSPITKPRLATFREYRKGRNIAPKTIDQQESKLEKLSAFLKVGERNLDFDAVSAWLDSLKLASKTLAQYLLAGSVFWRWAMKHDARWREDFKDRANPFENHDLPQVRGKAKTDAQRTDFNLEDISKLHTAASTEGHAILADLILLGTYTGARIEELCQLKAEHVIEPDGIKSFDIVDSKTAAGIRVVPIHPALSALVNRLVEQSKGGYLVPSDSKNKYGIRSDALSKAFGRLKKAQGFGPQQVFHSIRKTVVTQLDRASVRWTLIAELVGHETGTTTMDVYSQGATAAQKLEAISKLPLLPIVPKAVQETSE
ncbi:tyrosine-type recombinase/integrase [Pseudomonas proteolytica]|uniref:tyrosine-type recombinase/integrase n=1 Tax=Pseudomonas proteolytica TaxID=219574 RepID=UPI0023DF3C96|nr:tyrosine-type recombinase/integrase [Pseudomonas proteolytica]MDF3164492.1 tyrosine-type recombinase/integrase [Pseudomonas proteolytica]